MTAMKIVWELPVVSIYEVAITFIVFVVTLTIIRGRRNAVNVAVSLPGPRSWPIVGNLLQLGEYPYLTLTKMREEYGDVLCIKLGMVPVVVVSGMETIKQALIKQGNSFAGRPDFYTFSLIGNGKTMTFSEKYGESWKLHKKIAKNALRAFSLTEAQSSTCSCLLEEHVCAEATELVKVLLNKAEKEGAFDPVEPITSTVANVICALCFGKRYEHNDKEFLNIVHTNHEVMRTFASGNVADVFPFFRYLPSPSLKSMIKFVNRLNNFMIKSIQEHYTTFDKNCVRDITDTLIALCQNRKVGWNNAVLTDEQIVSTVTDIFGAGFDTIITGLQWCLLYLIQYPEFQTRIQQEIDEKVGQSRLPRFEDRTLLPFTEAFINEVFRHTTYMPFTIPHCTTASTTLNGYFIPKDTCVFINQYQVNHDETLWQDAGSFIPQRFLDERGGLNKDVTEKVMMFGMGMRRCLGLHNDRGRSAIIECQPGL
ncbi:cytochrome P450 1A1 isoform X2 [Callorhinchus milii]|uniref:cytochrome P450 1A1 isoform X2 n=1 Tax=Callorhinchus milii TaxID=7868 RepID=UPI0004572BF1|nr:cytochrome P450 1A1 isoform X2 [Callorhinchus milii]|eukprot:gi/632962862/ref/XP_007897559.1/ PREDICTED: cytochrome P450 1A1-like isoform X2 [Callorhinchus milii]